MGFGEVTMPEDDATSNPPTRLPCRQPASPRASWRRSHGCDARCMVFRSRS